VQAARGAAERAAAEAQRATLERERQARQARLAEEEAASAAYLARNSRRCPKCGIPVVRVEGCTDMICGRDYHAEGATVRGCGHRFRWTGLDLDGRVAPFTAAE
jgi:uncharacterized protein with PIN domain